MISSQSSREILKNSKIKNKLKECFKKCALGRVQLRKCVVNAMNAGLTKENVLAIVNKMATGALFDEASLCSIVAIGQALRYEEEHEKTKPTLMTDDERKERERLESKYGKVWSTEELGQDFDVTGFMAPFVVVRRKSDNKKGSLEFQHRPRFYFNWKED